MSTLLVEYRLRIRNAANDDDALTVTTTRGGSNPYMTAVPTGDGASFDPFTGSVTSGSFTVRIADPITSGTTRLFTSVLEDSDNRPQLGQRRAFLEFREDAGTWTTLYAGRITRYALANDIEWDVTVGDFMQAERDATVFARRSSSTTADGYESLATYLARWPHRGCIVGGPILGLFQGVPTNGWILKVLAQTAQHTKLRVDYTYNEAGTRMRGVTAETVAAVNQSAMQFFEPYSVDALAGTKRYGFGTWPGLAMFLNGVEVTPTNGKDSTTDDLDVTLRDSPDALFRSPSDHTATLFLDGTVGRVGESYTVYAITRQISDQSAVYFFGHPLDLLTRMWTEVGFPYDLASIETTRALVGGNLRILVRVGSAQRLGQYAEAAVYGWAGIGVRMGTDGEMETFASRIFTNTVPSVTISDDDVEDGSVQAYDLDATEALKTFVLEHEPVVLPRLLTRQFTGPVMVPPGFSLLRSQPALTTTYERTNADADAVASGVIAYRVPGQISFLGARGLSDLENWINAKASEVFDRRGRGGLVASMLLLRSGSGATVALGDEVLVDLPQMPRANKRMGDAAVSSRAMQVVHLTPTLAGKQVTLMDSGASASPIATVPTHTLAASTDHPRTVMTVTITNAATLNTSHYGVRVQWASIVTGASAPEAKEYADVAYFYPDNVLTGIPTAAFTLPAVIAGRTIYVRARTEIVSARPSDWSTPVSGALAAFSPPTALTATRSATDPAVCAIAWTVGQADAHSELFVLPDDSSDDDWIPGLNGLGNTVWSQKKLVELLAPGSSKYSLDDLEASSSYGVMVNHLDPSTGDRSTQLHASFRTIDDATTLDPPYDPDAFSFAQQSDPLFGRLYGITPQAGLYGIAVVASEGEAQVEVAEALETAVASGLYGTYVTVGTIKSAADGWTVWYSIAPNDGLRRKLKARHTQDGATSSTYCTPVTVTTWTFDPLISFPGTLKLAARFTLSTGTNSNYYYGSIAVTDTDPQGAASVSLIDRETTSASKLISPTTLFAGLTTGTPTTSFLTTGAVSVVLLKPEPWVGESTEDFVAIADNRAPAELAVVIPERDVVTPVVSGVSITVNTYDPANTTITVNKTISPDYYDFVVVLARDGGGSSTGTAGATAFNVTTLFGFNFVTATAGVQTHTLNATVVARDDEAATLHSAASGIQTYQANPDS